MKTSELLGTDRIINIQTEELPLISFVMPVYNDGESVADAINSIFDNDWPNIEVIAVNDCSPDNTKEVLDNLTKKHKRLTVVHLKENKGACVARNEGAKLAKGKYIAWLPADAKIFPGTIRVWVETLERFPEYDFLYGGYRFVNQQGETQSNYWSDQFDPYFLEVRNYIDGTFPMRTAKYWEVAKLMGQPDGLWDPNIKSLQDWDFWLSVVKEGKGKGFYYRDIFFETTMPHPGGLSDDSHRNWLARSNQIKKKHGIPDRKICVTSPGAPFFAKYIAKILDADYQEMPSWKDHDYDLIYLLGFYPSIIEQCAMTFLAPQYMSQYESLMQQRKEIPMAPAIKVVHLIGTDLLQMRDHVNRLDLEVIKAMLNGKYDHTFTEFDPTHKEANTLGINNDILALPPRQYFETSPLPKKFTVAVYAPKVNQALYNVDMMVEVAKKLPNIDFKFFGDQEKHSVDGNIEYIGYVMDMAKLIKESSCLIRITSHDGLPQSVLEFLSAGRRVIFNHDFKYVNTANKQITVEAIVKAIKEESKEGLNLEAAKWIRKNFTKEKFKEKIYSLLTYDPKKFWEKNADNWIKLRHKFYGTKDWEFIEPYVQQIKPKSVIDIGCGDGQWSDKFDADYVGIDISEKLIKHAQKSYPNKKFYATSLEESGKHVTGKRDLAFCYTVFEHITEENMPQAVAALKKLAKKAILIEPLNIKTKNYCHNHDYNKWFKVKKVKQLDKRVLMVVDLS